MGHTSISIRNQQPSPSRSISLSEIIAALSFAIELTDGAVSGHALRTCLIGMRIADEAGFTEEEKTSLYYALLLKDIGNEEMIGLRCDRGRSIVHKLSMGSLAADAVGSLEEHWDGSGYPNRARGEEIPQLARVGAIAQHLDMFSIGRSPIIAVETLKEWSGSWFDPRFVQAALSLDRNGRLWDHCRAADSHETTRSAVLDLDPHRCRLLDDSRIDRICEAFAEVVDAKSHFTFRHSMGVAKFARGIAQTLKLPPDRIRLVWRAALLHDLGKLGISNRILNKTTPLTEAEWRSVHLHPGLTRRILEQIEPFQEIAIVAGEHHEKLDGSGYPNRLTASDLAIESRIIAVADVYGALSENRPYREGLHHEEIVPILDNLAGRQLDGDCIEALLHHLNQAPLSPADNSVDQLDRFCA
jgi:HD-GYP domain-containing protein (c-di-GMP phosphodiesterase class II)